MKILALPALLVVLLLGGCRVVLDDTVVGERQVFLLERGLVVVDGRWFEGTVGLQRTSFDGGRVQTWASGGPPVVAEDGRLAWSTVTVSEARPTGRTAVYVASASGRLLGVQRLRPGIVVVHGFAGDRVVFSRWYRRGVFVTDLRHRPERLAWWPRREHPGPVSPDGTMLVGYRGTRVVVHDLADGTVVSELRGEPGWVGVTWLDAARLAGVVPPA